MLTSKQSVTILKSSYYDNTSGCTTQNKIQEVDENENLIIMGS